LLLRRNKEGKGEKDIKREERVKEEEKETKEAIKELTRTWEQRTLVALVMQTEYSRTLAVMAALSQEKNVAHLTDTKFPVAMCVWV
jgi:ABC-type branched-subunit amino acid transport system substrate-binding protein